jgi:hypothetical protein
MSNNQYSIGSFLKKIKRSEAVQQVNKQAADQAAQMWLDMYMSPGDLSDAPYRLGSVIATDPGNKRVSTLDFPPLKLRYVKKTNLPERMGGFKNINDRINALQGLLRNITGEIRTKITEWDVSMYLQEGLYNKENYLQYSLTYRMFSDNFRGYRDSRALNAGILNAAVSAHRHKPWNPRSDNDLSFWYPPETSLLWSSALTRAGWTSWYPPYWQLFFNDADINQLGPEDQVRFSESLDKKRRDRESNNSSSKDMKEVREEGINMHSPILFGGPYGMFKDPRSIAGYLENSPLTSNSPKIAPTSDASHLINKQYADINPMQGIDTLNNGWTSVFKVAKLISYTTTKWVTTSQSASPSSNHRGRRGSSGQTSANDRYQTSSKVYSDRYGRTYTKTGRYQSTTETRKIWVNESRTGMFPNATYTLRRIPGNKLSGSAARRWYDAHGGSVSYSGGIFGLWRTFNVTPYLTAISGIRGVDLAAQIPVESQAPVILTSADGKIVLRGKLEQTTYPEQYRVKLRFLWWTWWTTRVRQVPCFQLDTSTIDLFRTGLSSPVVRRFPWWMRRFVKSQRQDTYSAYPTSPDYLTSNGRQYAFKGLFFHLPARRSIASNSNFITGSWAQYGVPAAKGAQLARAFTTGFWMSGINITGVPLHTNISNVYNKLLPVHQALETLAQMFEGINSEHMKIVFGALEAKTKKKSSVITAYRELTSVHNLNSFRNKLSALSLELSGFMGVIRPVALVGESGLSSGTVNYFRNNYSGIIQKVLDPGVTRIVKSYLTLLYEWRLVFIKYRMNKVDGTLVQCARMEIALAMLDASATPNNFEDVGLITEDLPIVHSVTNISIVQRAKALEENAPLPLEKLAKVYVKVQYKKGVIVRPKAGLYQLQSLEFLGAQGDIAEINIPLTFAKGNPKCPPIVRDVIARINASDLQKLVATPGLSPLEKICASKVTEDWWEIVIPTRLVARRADFISSLRLTMVPVMSTIQGVSEILGGVANSPVLETQGKIMPGSTFGASEAVLKEINPSVSN